MKVKFEKEDLCLVAVPSYGGRVPLVVVDMFRNVKADGTNSWGSLGNIWGMQVIADQRLRFMFIRLVIPVNF